ncbi:Right handed beta helix region [Saccharicrinis carchari]|uniref:Right handed beta helix region n=1 Tax=Saccharicrinis carchari TaxID=1168039 RepID=A0A521ACF0_SACCC|nr:right-handed parallel beta-helix repeat-containing protein [Saccharicrinis carchari]SMO32451.1 Right handed beta helix region [Saccharicrinis carchari]
MKQASIFILSLFLLVGFGCTPAETTISFNEFGVDPDSQENASTAAAKLIEHLQARKDTSLVTVIFPKGRYDFYEEGSFVREYYISNHDQDNPKKVGFALENLQNIVIDGQGSDLIFHGRMIPFALLNNSNVTLKNMHIDYEVPALRQLKITKVNKEADEVVAEIYPPGNYRIQDNKLVVEGESYEFTPFTSMAFRADKRLTYLRADVAFDPASASEKSPNTLSIKGWQQVNHTSPGERYVLRTYHRPTPGIFVSECLNTGFKDVTVHYAEGMGLLVQMSENITLDGFNVCLRGDDDERFFTTQADATHFSACKGIIISKNGLYEGMADDAINVHGTYLRVTKRIDDHTLQARYMHPQAWGFKWGEPGDQVQFVESEKMELVDQHLNTLQSIKAVDKPTEFGAKEFEITFADALPQQISEMGKYGIENLTWTPEVLFSNNTVRNNRARGTLFSTPKRVVCENNIFDHTHGTAILLCGDCNGWYETGPCKDVLIKNNQFINGLTAYYQFTNAAISIYPEIPNLEDQEQFFHSGIVIEDNTFEMFDQPILYAKSTNGLIFRNNTIKYNSEFEPFHWNKHPFFFEKVDNITISNNHFEKEMDWSKAVRTELSEPNSVVMENNTAE